MTLEWRPINPGAPGEQLACRLFELGPGRAQRLVGEIVGYVVEGAAQFRGWLNGAGHDQRVGESWSTADEARVAVEAAHVARSPPALS